MFTPGTHLLPHRGVTNTRVVAHLPLIVPPDCALRVGGEEHAWQEGRVVVFDDTYEHEAWNRSDQVRVVLIFDLWNPAPDRTRTRSCRPARRRHGRVPPGHGTGLTPMRLPQPFYRLPVRFDVARLMAEVAQLPASAWAPHPNQIDGNSSLRLISVDGGENDDVSGRMLPTPHLEASPYLRQVLASFGVVWSRSRLMRLAPGASVPPHADINHHWFFRVRLHIPVQTHANVAFHCGDERVHMAAGEAWVFDNWRLHRVENPTDVERIHLVADTSGTAPFWRFVAQAGLPVEQWRELRFDPGASASAADGEQPAARDHAGRRSPVAARRPAW